MRRLILIRHAKSAWNEPGLDDHDRRLAPRGIRAAAWIGETLRSEGWLPDAVLCSTAARARETLELSRIDAPTMFLRDIYEHMTGDFVDIIRRFGGDVPTLGLVGHNTGMETTALLLAGDDADFGGYPTGAITVMDFALDSWPQLAEGSGRIVAFRRPRDR